MTFIKVPSPRSPQRVGLDVMLKTYTLYLRDGRDGPPRFEPAMCATPAELMLRVRATLSRYPECERIDVFFGDTELYSVKQVRTP